MAEKGSITFSTALDNSQLEKEYKQAVKDIEQLEKELSKETGTKTGLETKLEEAQKAADAARKKLEELYAEQQKLQEMKKIPAPASAGVEVREKEKEVTEQINQQQKELEYQETLEQKLSEKVDQRKEKEKELNAILDQRRNEAVQIEEQMAKVAEAANVPGLKQRFADLFSGIAKTAAKFAKRIQTMFMKVFLFSVILKGLRELKELIGNAVANNDAAAQSLARLKGAFLTMIQPIIDFAIPILTTLMNWLTKLAVVAGHFISLLFGQSYTQSKKNAAALQGQADGIEAVGDAAKNASGYLAGFDELNTMNDTSSSSTAPSFDYDDFVEGSKAAEKFEDDLAQIGGGVVKIVDGAKQAIHGFLTGDVDEMFNGLHTIFDGLGDILHGATDLIFDFLDTITGGRFTAFLDTIRGYVHEYINAVLEYGHGVLDLLKGIITGDVDLILQGLNGMFSGAMHMTEAMIKLCTTIMEGLIIGFLDWLDKITGGRFHTIIQAVKDYFIEAFDIIRSTVHEVIEEAIAAFKSFTEFIAAVLSGDWEKAWSSLKDVATHALNGVLAAFEGFLSLFVNGINTLTGLLGEIKIDVPEWVPKVGGQQWGINIPKIPTPKLPRLASGAVIPPNREFAAVLGDQSSGMNIEAPEDLIRAIVREESGGGEIVALLTSILSAVEEGHNIYVDKRILGRVASEQLGNMVRMGGAY